MITKDFTKDFNESFVDFVRDRLESINYGETDAEVKECLKQYYNIIDELRKKIDFETLDALEKCSINAKNNQMIIAYQLGFSDAMKTNQLSPKHHFKNSSKFQLALSKGFLTYFLNETYLKNLYWHWCQEYEKPCCTILRKAEDTVTIEIDFIPSGHRLTDTEVDKILTKVTVTMHEGIKANKTHDDSNWFCGTDLVFIDGIRKDHAEEFAKTLNEIVVSVLQTGGQT